jgi:mannose-1-phosphate guanylyltransferase
MRYSSQLSSPLWAVVLAGGDGVRLRPAVRLVCGDDRPKQYAPLLGTRSLLCQTLERTALRIAPWRTLVTATRTHACYLREALDGIAVHSFLQPCNRGTAAGVLASAHWIARRDPEATVAFFPSDHFVLESQLLMDHVLRLAGFVERHPDRIVLAAASPGWADPGYGWIELGVRLEDSGAGDVCSVNAFVEKPSREAAQKCFADGWLWNTFIMVARAGTVLAAGREHAPEIEGPIGRAMTEEDKTIAEAYAEAREDGFSEAVIGRSRDLAASLLPGILWSDLGTPERYAEVQSAMRFIRPVEQPPAADPHAESAPDARRAGTSGDR